MKTIGVGIIGFGYMGFFHYNKIKQMERMSLVGVYDIDEEKKRQSKEDGVTVFESLDEMLTNAEIKLVIISTPNDSHYEYAMRALKAKKNVLCEKPAMMTMAQLEKVLKAAEDNGVIFTTHQNRRWDKDYSVVKNVVQNKSIGGIYTIYSETFGQRGVCFGWRADPEKGGGMLYDWGIHLIDQMLQLFPDSQVISIYARLRSVLTPVVDDYFELELEFDNDVIAHISVGTFALQERPRWFVFGDRGTLRLDDFSGEKGGIAKIKDNVRGFARIKANSNLGPSRTMAHLERQDYDDISLPKPVDSPLEFYRNLEASILDGEEIYVKPKEMIRDMKIMERAFESSKKKERIAVSI